ncbi:hypothetical protein ACFORG_16145 [Lutimaribacter marinistellae]|uniref:Uncharacterized protein n=1 Tax=Lutimaribacter marinistellae TaxID=1820329 RepID=A0ABV7TI53_9RHOB
MTVASLINPILPIFRGIGRSRRRNPAPRGSLPRWTDDPQLRAQFLKDAGLTPGDPSGQSTWDPKRPFLMQNNTW